MTQYEKLVARAEDMIIQQICGEVEGALKVHLLKYELPPLSISQLRIVP